MFEHCNVKWMSKLDLASSVSKVGPRWRPAKNLRTSTQIALKEIPRPRNLDELARFFQFRSKLILNVTNCGRCINFILLINMFKMYLGSLNLLKRTQRCNLKGFILAVFGGTTKDHVLILEVAEKTITVVVN